jgi:FdrA protein
MPERVVVRRGAYHDSVTLMLVSREAAAEEGAETVSVAMATPLNVDLIAGQGFELPSDLAPNDLVIAIRAADEEAVLAAIDRALARRDSGGGEAERPAPRSLVSAARRHPELNLAFLSVPGRHVGYEAAAAVEAGCTCSASPTGSASSRRPL